MCLPFFCAYSRTLLQPVSREGHNDTRWFRLLACFYAQSAPNSGFLSPRLFRLFVFYTFSTNSVYNLGCSTCFLTVQIVMWIPFFCQCHSCGDFCFLFNVKAFSCHCCWISFCFSLTISLTRVVHSALFAAVLLLLTFGWNEGFSLL